MYLYFTDYLIYTILIILSYLIFLYGIINIILESQTLISDFQAYIQCYFQKQYSKTFYTFDTIKACMIWKKVRETYEAIPKTQYFYSYLPKKNP